MAPRAFGGILAPLVTPFDARGGILAEAFAANVRAHLAAGLSGVLVAGSSGEAPLLGDDERARLVAQARLHVPDDRWLLAGVGAESTRQTIARAIDAGREGADAVLVVSPHYYGAAATPPAALEAHFRAVADASPVPVLLYNIPKFVHFALEPETVAALAAHENVVGMKDSAGDLPRLAGYLRAQGPAFSVLTGHAPTFAGALRMGVRGAILAVSLFAPALALEVLRLTSDGDDAGADGAQARLSPLGRDVAGAMGIPGIKAAMRVVGLEPGVPRQPLGALGAEAVAEVAAMLEAAGVAAGPGMAAATAAAH